MTFDNSKAIISLRLKLFAATVILLTFIVLTYVAGMIKYPLLGMSDTAWTLILVTLYFMYAFMPLMINYQYIYFSDEGDTIDFRYFVSGITGGRKNSIKIKKEEFTGYRTDKRFFGIIISITLYQKINNKAAKYPPVYITALTREEREKLFRALDTCLPGN